MHLLVIMYLNNWIDKWLTLNIHLDSQSQTHIDFLPAIYE